MEEKEWNMLCSNKNNCSYKKNDIFKNMFFLQYSWPILILLKKGCANETFLISNLIVRGSQRIGGEASSGPSWEKDLQFHLLILTTPSPPWERRTSVFLMLRSDIKGFVHAWHVTIFSSFLSFFD